MGIFSAPRAPLLDVLQCLALDAGADAAIITGRVNLCAGQPSLINRMCRI